MNLHGRSAVITGGGRGIGVAVARALAQAGARVLVAARSTSEVEVVAGTLRDEGHQAHHATCDVTDPASVHALAATAREKLGDVDILVNNAGIAGSAPLAKITLDEWNRIFAVNVTGTMLCAQAFVPAMVARKWGRLVNVASIAGRSGAPYIATYAASKHAVIGFTRCVAAEVAAFGVTANAVCPGYVDTPMTTQSVERVVAKTGRSAQEALEAILRTSPQHRLLEPEEIAHVVLALCAHEARGINGQAIVIDGGAILAG
jgi:NAD(P)-dependent dehydrogenase (short-subunit alcohol dehydrogenase family)